MESSSRQTYTRLLRQILPYWRAFTVSLVSMVILAATEPALPALLQQVVGGFENKDVSGIPMLAGLLVALFFVRGVSAFGSAQALAHVAGHLVQDLREAMFERLLSVPARFYDARQSGELISKVTYDAAQVSDAGTQVLTVVVRDSLAIVGLLGWMIWLDWQLSLVALAVAPVVVLIVQYFSRRLRRMSSSLQRTMGEVTHVVDEAIAGERVVRTFGAQAYEKRRFRDVATRARRFQVKFSAAAAGNAPIAQFVTALALAAILVIAAHRYTEGAITLAGFVSFFTAMGMLFSPLKRLTGITGKLQRGIAAAESIFDLIDQPAEPDNGTVTLERARGRLAFENVSFSYPTGNAPALAGIDLVVQPGETIALVGPSGSGKSTLAGLIARFYEPSDGRILIDGIDLRDATLTSLRAQLALVSQDIVLFDDTVAANIAYGRLAEYSRDQIADAARAAHAMDFILKLPDGLESAVGEGGSRLSGGQRQRIAIARAFLKDAPILVLDEATSALDNASERHVQAALEQLRRGRTTVVIAHRLSSVENADRIVLMDQGRIVDVGTHHALLERSPLYAGLYRFQFARQHEARPAAEMR
ncbi:MAG: lipid A export permease/ATP-binding protein MsbA [Chromatiales bacterium]|nr:lipid A export permease/ATP-binding protein MsbA [Chromatiales bacterium]